MAKYVLNTSDDDLDFALIGLTCLENQYTVSALIDDALKINLFLSGYIPFNLKDSRVFKFSLYNFLDEELGLEYFLIPNNSNLEEPNPNGPADSSNAYNLFAGIEVDESVKLIKELSKTDYLLILKGEDLHNYQFKIIEKLKNLPEIIQIQAIEPQDLPSRRNLIF
ncbi:IPExxxVDY family protein [Aurantibacillus circumpalustris]|uniref:IPExxxVDY family protein n=1 Tax=Aurantibacillus circumpalustris TaxID=3036359 RepID=UPI00295A9EEA|nr:IPExxxVDY family protein [Aurantibacillus circumpalustris]